MVLYVSTFVWTMDVIQVHVASVGEWRLRSCMLLAASAGTCQCYSCLKLVVFVWDFGWTIYTQKETASANSVTVLFRYTQPQFTAYGFQSGQQTRTKQQSH